MPRIFRGDGTPLSVLHGRGTLMVQGRLTRQLAGIAATGFFLVLTGCGTSSKTILPSKPIKPLASDNRGTSGKSAEKPGQMQPRAMTAPPVVSGAGFQRPPEFASGSPIPSSPIGVPTLPTSGMPQPIAESPRSPNSMSIIPPIMNHPEPADAMVTPPVASPAMPIQLPPVIDQ